MELLFPQGFNKEELVMFITTRIVKLVFDLFCLNDIQGLEPEVLINAFNNFKNLQDLNLDSFVKGLKALLKHVQKTSGIKELEFFLPALDIVSVIGQDTGDFWKLKNPSLKLLSSSVISLSKDNASENGPIVKNFVQFLSLVSSSYEIPCDLNTNQPLESKDVLRIINNFSNSLELDKMCKKAGIHEKFVSNLIYLVIAYTKQETHELPKELIKDLEDMLNIKNIGKNEFIPFCFDLANTIYNTPKRFHQRIQQSASGYGLDDELQNFLKILSCYALEDYKAHYPSLRVEKNGYFVKIAEAVKIMPIELLGLIDFVYRKKNCQSIDAFFIAIAKRMGIKIDKLDALKQLIDLLLSDDETEILQAVKALDLEYGQFLLMGKGILNPRFIPKSQFKEVGITDDDLIKDKDTVAGSSTDTYEYWKGELRNNLSEDLSDRKHHQSPEDQKREAVRNLIKMYLSDWNTCNYSKKNVVALISVLSNPLNDLKKKLSDRGKGASLNGIDFLVTVLALKDLALEEGKRYPRLDREKESSINILAEYLSIDAEVLKNCLKMFVLNDLKTVINSFFTFFPNEKENQEVLQKVLDYSFKQVNIIQSQTEFIANKLPNSIELFDKKSCLPKGLFMQIFYGNSKGSMSISDLLELAFLPVKKLVTAEEEQEKLISGIYKAGLFAQGLLSQKDIAKEFEINDDRMLRLFSILTQPDQQTRLITLTELLKDKYHPFRVFIAFYGLLMRQNFKMSQLEDKKEGKKSEEESIKHYLAGLFKVYPEVFDLFEFGFERNITNFIQKALPFVRRMSKSSIVDSNLMESLFSLSLGEHFSTGYLANRLEMSSDIIDFFVTIIRLATKPTRKKELVHLPQSLPVQKILTKLKVKAKELVALSRLIFNIFDNENAMTEILENIGLKRKKNEGDSKEVIDIELFKGLAALNTSINSSLNIFENREELAKERAATENFFNSLGLCTNDDSAFIISRLAAGNYLILNEYKQQLDWVFPNNDNTCEVAIKSLTMALCGLISPNIEVTANVKEEIKGYITKYYPKLSKPGEKFSFKEPSYNRRSKGLPNNSLGYAIYLTYYSIDIAPCWVQAFFFDEQIFQQIESTIEDGRQEFLLSLVLSFISIPEIAKDYIGLYEWNAYCTKFYTEKKKGQSDIKSKDSPFSENLELYKFFSEQINFDYERTLELANEVGIFQQSEYWHQFFGKAEVFQTKVNASLLYFLTFEKNKSEKELIFTIVKQHLTKATVKFLPELAKVLYHKEGFKDVDEKRVIVGKMIYQAIVDCYKKISQKFYPGEQRFPGYELTDLCMLGTIMLLKTEQNMPYDRVLYNLHQLTMNIERKVYLNENFHKMSKFKLMKLVGISLGAQISNVVEWCLPSSLFTKEYAAALHTAKDDLERDQIKVQQCKKVALNYQDDKKNVVGDLGTHDGTYSNYKAMKEAILRADGWDYIQMLLGLSTCYMGDPQAENTQTIKDLEEKNKMFSECKTSLRRVYLSRELVSLVYNEKKPKKEVVQIEEPVEEQLNEEGNEQPEGEQEKEKLLEASSPKKLTKKDQILLRRKQKEAGEDKETLIIKENTIDIKTGISFVNLERKTEEFEEILTDPNMNLIQGIIRGEPSIVLKGDHVISRRDHNHNKAKIYMALLGLQSFQKTNKNDRKIFKEYLNIIAPFIESDISKLDELLTFFITKKPNLNDCVNVLELSEELVGLMLMSVKEKTKSHDDDEEEEGEEEGQKFSICEIIKKNIIDMDDKLLEAFEIIRNVYQFKLSGWLAVTKALIKRTDKGDILDPKSMKNHPLVKLNKMMNLKKMKKDHNSLARNEIYTFFKVDPKSKKDVFTLVFEQIILSTHQYSVDKIANTQNKPKKRDEEREKEEEKKREKEREKEKDFLLRGQQVIQSIVNRDITQLFAMLVLTNGEKVDLKPGLEQKTPRDNKKNEKKIETKSTNLTPDVPEQSFLEEILNLLGISFLTKNNIKLLKIFLTMASSNLTIFKDQKNYKSVINGIIGDMSESEVLGFVNNKEVQTKVGQLLLGVLAWDPELIMKAFITKETLKEAYLLYHIFGCLKLNKIISLGENYISQAETHLKVVVSAAIKRVTSKTAANIILKEGGNFDTLQAIEFGNMDPREIPKNLGDKIEKLLEITQSNTDKQASKTLLQHVMQSFQDKKSRGLSTQTNYSSFAGLITSICDGTVLIKLLNTFVKESPLKNFLLELIQFILNLVEKFFSSSNSNKIGYDNIINSFKKVSDSLKKVSKNKTLDKMLKMTPNIMKIYLVQSENSNNLAKVKIDVLVLIKNLIAEADSSEKSNLLYDMLSLVLGLNIQNFDHKKPGNKLKFDLGPSEKMKLFFSKIMPSIFPGLGECLCQEDFERIYQLIMKLKIDFMNNFKDPQKLREAVKEIAGLLEPFGGSNQELITALIALLEGNFEGIKHIMPIIVPGTSDETVDKVVKYMTEIKSVFNFDFGNKLSQVRGDKKSISKEKKIDSESWGLIMKKIREGTASSRDLFKVIDEAGDQSGAISEKEFAILANRLGVKLSEHRIKEIFAKVKGEKPKGTSECDLNEKEFEQALEYLQSKNLQQALQLLGITPEILTAILIRLVILLLLMFGFIFVGIKAFAIGGTFGSIINSIFPAAGGAGLGKEKDEEKDKLDSKNIEKASETGFEITSSEQL